MMDELDRDRRPQPGHGASERDDKSHADKHSAKREKRKEALDDTLELGLEDTFPGSDPVSVTQPPHSARDKHKP
jgi:hypothetical protein